jgi:hypothetical protein
LRRPTGYAPWASSTSPSFAVAVGCRSRTGRSFVPVETAGSTSDVYWDQWRVIVEIEGVGHFEPLAVVSDALRQNRIAIEDGVVLRIPLVGLRTQPADFMDQVEAALREGGCPLPRRAAAA